MTAFGAAMTGVRPKTTFLRPSVAAPMALEVARQMVAQKLMRRGGGPAAYAQRATENSSRATSFARACLRVGSA